MSDHNGKVVPHQVNLVWKSSTEVLSNKYEVVFVADIPQLGLARYKVKRVVGGIDGLGTVKTYNLKVQGAIK